MTDKYIMIPDLKPLYQVSILAERVDYNHKLMNIPAMWKDTRGADVKMVVLDSGIPKHIDLPHPEGKSFVNNYSWDKNGHATFVGGVINAIADNGMGVKGITPDSECYYGSVLGKDGSGSIDSIIKGIIWAVDDIKADIINMSLGIPGKASIGIDLKEACDYARSKGCLLVAAAGNDSGKVNYPARYDSVVAVGAIDRRRRIARFSSRGDQIQFVAGGVDNYSTYLNNSYATMSGTSFSSPAIASIAALILSSHRKKGEDLTPVEIIEHINKISIKLSDKEKSPETGNGIPVFAQIADTSNYRNKLVLFIRNLFLKLIGKVVII